MKTVAEFKRRIKVGAEVHTIWHMKFAGRDEKNNPLYTDEDKGERVVSISQSNSFALKTWQEGKKAWVDSWCNFPKATEVEFKEDGSVVIFEEDDRVTPVRRYPVLTYRITKDAPASQNENV